MQMILPNLHLDNKLQKIGFSVGVTYLSVLIFSLFFTSSGKVHVPSAFTDKAIDDVAPKSAGAIFRDFDRTEYRDKKAKWNIKAIKADYQSSNGLINLTKPYVTVYGKAKEKPTVIEAETSRLIVVESNVQRAFLEGNVVIQSGSGAIIKTATSEYVESESRLTSPDHVYITGPGYQIEGDSSDVNTQTDDTIIRGHIKSKFESAARMPLTFNNTKK